MPQDPSGEKLEFLKREEIRTMTKDLAKLRQQEAKKERERILKLQEEKKKLSIQTPTPVPAIQKQPEPKKIVPIPDNAAHQASLIPPPYKPPSKAEKILIRLAIAGIFLFILGNIIALLYYIFWREQEAPIQQPQQEQGAPEITPPPEPQPESPPASLIQEYTTIPLQYTESSQIPELLSQSLQRVLAPGFIRIILQHDKEYASPTDFFHAFSITPPQELTSVLRNNITPFLFSSNGKNRLGFVIETSEQAQAAIFMKSWEPTLERDTESFFAIMREKGIGYVPFFRETTYKQTPVRFQTFSREDFGIVYTLFQNRLIITESFETIKAIIDNISNANSAN